MVRLAKKARESGTTFSFHNPTVDNDPGGDQGSGDVELPIVAAVNGPAIGLGASLALLCDVIFAAEDAVFADPHVRVGIVAGDGGAAKCFD